MKQPAWIRHLSERSVTLDEYRAAQQIFTDNGWSLNYVHNYREFWLSRFHPDDALQFIRCRMGVDSAVRAIRNPADQLQTCSKMLERFKVTP